LGYKKERGEWWILYAEVPNEKRVEWRMATLTHGSEFMNTRPKYDKDSEGDITLTVASVFMEEVKVCYGICRNTQSLECPLAKFSSKNVFTSFATLSAYWKRNECPARGYKINCALSISFKSS
jgi:hypothetical protein